MSAHSNVSNIHSAKEFITLLTNLGYPNISNLQPEQILWAYEDLETRNILDWLCTNIDIEQNVLDIKDNWINPSTLRKTRKDIESIENEIGSKLKSQNHLSHHIDQLKLTLESIERKHANLKRISRDLDEKNKEIDRSIEQDSIKLDINTAEMLETIAQTLSERKLPEGKGKQQKNFIYQCTDEIAEILATDQSFTHELQRLCEILFSNDDTEKFESCNLANEVDRLKSLYSKTQIKFMKACTENKYQSTFLKVIKNEKMKMDSFIPDTNSLKFQLNQNTNDNYLLNKKLNDVMDSKINGLLSELTYLEIEVPILTADYKVKMQHQQKFINQLELVTDQLLSQYAHNQFVAQTFHIELDNQKAVHRLFSDLNDELKRRTEDINKRMLLMSGSDFVKPIDHKTVVDSHDDFLLSLKKLLNLDFLKSYSKEEKSLPFTTYDSLRERLNEVENLRSTSFNNVEQEWKAQQEFLKSCEEIENFLASLLYKDSKTSELLMTPQDLSDLQFSLRAKTNRIQPKINQITKNFDLPEHLESKRESFIRSHTDLNRK